MIVVENESVPHDRRVWQEASSLLAHGIEVIVVCPKGNGDEARAHELRDGVAIHRYTSRPSSGGITGYLREYAHALRETRRLVRLLVSQASLDAVQACNPPDGMLLAALAARRTGTALIFDHHDLVPELFASRYPGRKALHALTRIVERLTFAIADVVIATNESYREIAVRRGGQRPDNVFVVRNAPDLELFRPVEPDSSLRRGAPFLIGYLGVMGPQDGVDQALLALHDLRRRRDDWHAVFVGDGDLLDELEALTERLGLADVVEFTGWKEQDEVVRLIGSADVCLVPDPPNLLNNASSLVKVVEYMALGRAIAAYELPETRRTTGDAALFASSPDPRGLASAIDRLLDDPGLREALGQRARARVEGGLCWQRSEQELIAAYEHAFAITDRRRRRLR